MSDVPHSESAMRAAAQACATWPEEHGPKWKIVPLDSAEYDEERRYGKRCSTSESGKLTLHKKACNGVAVYKTIVDNHGFNVYYYHLKLGSGGHRSTLFRLCTSPGRRLVSP